MSNNPREFPKLDPRSCCRVCWVRPSPRNCHCFSSRDGHKQAVRKIPCSCIHHMVLTSIPHRLPILTDADIVMTKLDSTLFPGISSSIEVHDGFAGTHERFGHCILSTYQSVPEHLMFLDLRQVCSQPFRPRCRETTRHT